MTRVVEVRMSEAQRRKSPKYGSPRAKQNRDGFKRFQAGRLIDKTLVCFDAWFMGEVTRGCNPVPY